MNDFEILSDPDDLTELVLGVSRGEVDKAEVAVFLKTHAQEITDNP